MAIFTSILEEPKYIAHQQKAKDALERLRELSSSRWHLTNDVGLTFVENIIKDFRRDIDVEKLQFKLQAELFIDDEMKNKLKELEKCTEMKKRELRSVTHQYKQILTRHKRQLERKIKEVVEHEMRKLDRNPEAVVPKKQRMEEPTDASSHGKKDKGSGRGKCELKVPNNKNMPGYQPSTSAAGFQDDTAICTKSIEIESLKTYLSQISFEEDITELYNQTAQKDRLLQQSNSQTKLQNNPQPRYPFYGSLKTRLDSYRNWQLKQPNSHSLSQSGFFATGCGDLVRCFQCGIGLKDFSEGDNSLMEHIRHSGKCPYLIGLVGEAQLAFVKRQFHLTDMIAQETSNCRHPQYMTKEARLETYNNWPRDLWQSPKDLADAGFFFTGFEDLVRCFTCDGGLRQWEEGDNPWLEHRRWFPACSYIRQEKGDDYIRRVKQLCAEKGECGFRAEDRSTTYSQSSDFLQDFSSMGLTDTSFGQKDQQQRKPLCIMCTENNVDALFMPCIHHWICMQCAEQETNCPVSDRYTSDTPN